MKRAYLNLARSSRLGLGPLLLTAVLAVLLASAPHDASAAWFPSKFTGGVSWDATYTGPYPGDACQGFIQGGTVGVEIIRRDTCYVYSTAKWPATVNPTPFFTALAAGPSQSPNAACTVEVSPTPNNPLPWAPNPLGTRLVTYSSACMFASPGCVDLQAGFTLPVATVCAGTGPDVTWALLANGCPAQLYGACTAPTSGGDPLDAGGCPVNKLPQTGQIKLYPTSKCGYLQWDDQLVNFIGTNTITKLIDPVGNEYLQHACTSTGSSAYVYPDPALYPPGWTIVNVTITDPITIGPLRPSSTCAGQGDDLGDALDVGCMFMLAVDGAGNAYHRIKWTGGEPLVLVQARNPVPVGAVTSKAARPVRPDNCQAGCNTPQPGCSTGGCDSCVTAAAGAEPAASTCKRCQTSDCWSCVSNPGVQDVRQCARCRTGGCFTCLAQASDPFESYCPDCTSDLCYHCVPAVGLGKAQYCPYVTTQQQVACLQAAPSTAGALACF